MNTPVLNVRDLVVEFKTEDGAVTAVNKVGIQLGQGEVLGLIGESGSGKSVTLRALLRLLPERKSSISGIVEVDGRNVLEMSDKELRAYRGGETSMIFQEPATAFDPVYTVGFQISESIRNHLGASRAEARARALELLKLVGIPSPETRLDNYPHEMSGGMRQRAMIALALASSPKLLLADEPTTALDATVQIQVILLLRELQRDLRMGVIFVTHDIGVAAEISDQVAVMYAGRIVENGKARDVLKTPHHPYTEGLLSSTVHGAKKGETIDAIPGMPPNLADMPPGCAFAPRCRYATEICHQEKPELETGANGRRVACFHALEVA
ncbi:ABC transporter ATP-binding protein [Sedimentitalea sp. JM2-8]|uniref:ABC transporter ATP-binding protein n=1 Tax=Sedimentitalea xiamensis TaxID=3050037 RepID=A0ABT7FJN3_9RHOB|nr:ABC transporter ATP-binding protein [Sedimentitalea xiamensis]MDK3074984.1 ABC transporter ATP-binding protein [Sedimentitalea xiamensis]